MKKFIVTLFIPLTTTLFSMELGTENTCSLLKYKWGTVVIAKGLHVTHDKKSNLIIINNQETEIQIPYYTHKHNPALEIIKKNIETIEDNAEPHKTNTALFTFNSALLNIEAINRLIQEKKEFFNKNMRDIENFKKNS